MNRLNDLAATATENDCEEMENELEDFMSTAFIGDEQQQRILSSVMRKAGFEMKENITVKKTKRHGKRFVGFIAAAAVLATCAVGAYAYNAMTHKDKVSIYYTEDGAQKLEEYGLASGVTVENGSIQLTLDTVLCDGNYVSGIYTLTALTDDAKAHLPEGMTELVYADTGEEVYPVGGGAEGWYGDAVSECEVTRKFTYPLRNSYIDGSRPLRLEFFEYTETGERDEYGNNIVIKDYGCFDGIGFDLLTTANVQTKELRSADGAALTLSPYGVSEAEENWAYPEDGELGETPIDSIFIISTDGERTDIMADLEGSTIENSGNPGSGSFWCHFGRILDIDNISGVEINGVEYSE